LTRYVWGSEIVELAPTVVESPQPNKVRRGLATEGGSNVIASLVVSLLKKINEFGVAVLNKKSCTGKNLN